MSDMFFMEENRVEIDGDYDVIVVGGGVAGVAAALAAKRKGKRTLLIEKSVMLGGLATLGLIAIYLPMCDGNGRKMVGGIAEEFLHLSIKYGYDSLAPEWTPGCDRVRSAKRYETVYSPSEFVVALDELIAGEGIDILFDTVFSVPIMENGLCKGIIVDTKSGRLAYTAKAFVDSTGDSDLMYRAGADCVDELNYLSLWAYTTNLDIMKKAVEENNIKAGIHLEWFGANAFGEGEPEGARMYSGLDVKEVTSFLIDSRKMLKSVMDKNKSNEQAILTLPGMAQYRKTRRIAGYYTMTEDDIDTHFEDSIGSVGDWRKAGPTYEIPYRALIAPAVKNIVTAGRTIASSGDAWEITRVIPPAAMTGQAAGVAAAMAAEKGIGFEEVSVPDLQNELAESGVLIHF